MAKSQESFNKKEKAKKKLQKRQQKEQRRDEKRHEGGSKANMDDMMAYVDENGNLSSVPPDPKKMVKVKLEDIEIGIRKEEDLLDPDVLPKATVTYFDEAKGYGFISDINTQERIFVHINNLTEEIKVGDTVEYTAKKTPRGLQAETVRKSSQ